MINEFKDVVQNCNLRDLGCRVTSSHGLIGGLIAKSLKNDWIDFCAAKTRPISSTTKL